MDQITNTIILKPEINALRDPHYISLVESDFNIDSVYQTIPKNYSTANTIKPYFSEKKLRQRNRPIFMSPLTQMYAASLTIVGLFIVFRLSLPK